MTDVRNITSYDDLPKELIEYIEYIEKETEVAVKIVSLGPDRKETIQR